MFPAYAILPATKRKNALIGSSILESIALGLSNDTLKVSRVVRYYCTTVHEGRIHTAGRDLCVCVCVGGVIM